MKTATKVVLALLIIVGIALLLVVATVKYDPKYSDDSDTYTVKTLKSGSYNSYVYDNNDYDYCNDDCYTSQKRIVSYQRSYAYDYDRNYDSYESYRSTPTVNYGSYQSGNTDVDSHDQANTYTYNYNYVTNSHNRNTEIKDSYNTDSRSYVMNSGNTETNVKSETSKPYRTTTYAEDTSNSFGYYKRPSVSVAYDDNFPNSNYYDRDSRNFGYYDRNYDYDHYSYDYYDRDYEYNIDLPNPFEGLSNLHEAHVDLHKDIWEDIFD